jgi:alpha-1,3-mannosyltransferase
LFTSEESEEIDFAPGPSHGKCCAVVLSLPLKDWTVWCWGWDGAGDIDGPDVDPIWERMPDRAQSADAVKVKHQRDGRDL